MTGPGPVSARVHSPQRLAAVARTGLLDTGAEEPFDRLTRLACELLDAPFGFVTVVDERRSFWKSCTGVAATEPSDRQNLVEESFCQYVIAADEAVIIRDARLNPLTRGNPSIESMGVVAWAGFPVRSPDGQVLGTFCVVDQRVRDWTEREVRILEVLAHAASGEVGLRIRVDEANAATLVAQTAERAAIASADRAALLAHTLQDSLLPPQLPTVDGLEMAAVYVAGGDGMTVMGDFYDVVPTTRGGWSLFVGDVSGHGAAAARRSAVARYTLRSSAVRQSRPPLVARDLDTALSRSAGADELPGFVALAYATVLPEPPGFRLLVTTAGHPPVLVRRGDGELVTLGTNGSVLGSLTRAALSIREDALGPGDTMILYTDGVTGARAADDRGRFLELAGLLAIVAAAPPGSASDLVATIRREVLSFCGGRPHDDIAILVARVHEG